MRADLLAALRRIKAAIADLEGRVNAAAEGRGIASPFVAFNLAHDLNAVADRLVALRDTAERCGRGDRAACEALKAKPACGCGTSPAVRPATKR
jgi:hypothetical protein